MNEILEFLKEFNVQTILSMAVIVWYFTRELKTSLESKIDKLDEDLRQMNVRLSRVEGTVYGKDLYKGEK